MQKYVSQNNFGNKFDLKKRYHYVDIHPNYHAFLRFSWCTGTIAAILLTNLSRPLTSFLHDKEIKICVYLENGAETEKNLTVHTTLS